ncbi:MAG TPA: N-acetylglucosamine-6-phosphate deacetylase [Tepidiformaceae bacterium]
MPNRLLIKDGILALPGGPIRADILCEGHRVAAMGRDLAADDARVLNANGLTLGPGFVDVHVHGGGGFSFFSSDRENVTGYSQWAPRNGVTSYLISTIGRDDDDTARRLTALAPTIGTRSGAEPLGFHLEGPFLNPDRRGAFYPSMLLPPSPAAFVRYQEAARGLIRQVTLAPELEGALELVATVLATGATAAMGHTDATTPQAAAGFRAGIRHVTHLFNAMRPLHQREGGPIAAALLEERATCELICDGAHVAPEALRLAYRLLGAGRTVVVTDNLEIAGTDEMTATFGDDPVKVEGFRAVRRDGTIVGSVATMDEHFRNVLAFLEVDVSTAFRLCATNPARVAGVENRKGALAHEMDADIVLLDRQLQVEATVCRGEIAFIRDPGRCTG